MRWDDEATKTWMHITTSRSIPIDIPDLATPYFPLHGHLASGSFGGNGRKKNRATGFDKLVCTSMRRWLGQGLRAGSAVRHVEQ